MVGQRAKTWALISIGAVFHLALIALPLAFLGRLEVFYTDLAAALFAGLTTLFYLSDAVGSTITRPHTFNRRGRDRAQPVADRRAHRLAGITCLSLLLLFWLVLARQALANAPTTTLDPIAMAGAALMTGGALLRWLAFRKLQGHFVTALTPVTGAPLVTDGVFALVRHPSELGLLLAAVGSELLFADPAGLLFAALVLLPFVLLRIRWEDQSLLVAFGDAYCEYQHRVASLTPIPLAVGHNSVGHFLGQTTPRVVKSELTALSSLMREFGASNTIGEPPPLKRACRIASAAAARRPPCRRRRRRLAGTRAERQTRVPANCGVDGCFTR